MASKGDTVNVTIDVRFAVAVLRGVAEQIPDDLTAAEIRDLLNDLADTMLERREEKDNG